MPTDNQFDIEQKIKTQTVWLCNTRVTKQSFIIQKTKQL